MTPGCQAVLLVEDDEGIRESIAELLRDKGYQVLTAVNGAEALVTLRAHATTTFLCLVDLMMPVMDGWDLIAHMQADERLAKLPVIVLTAGGDAMRPLPPASRHVKKPVRLKVLLELVREHCG